MGRVSKDPESCQQWEEYEQEPAQGTCEELFNYSCVTFGTLIIFLVSLAYLILFYITGGVFIMYFSANSYSIITDTNWIITNSIILFFTVLEGEIGRASCRERV